MSHTNDEVVADYMKYVKAIQMKDKLKTFAELKNKERNEAWKDYYKVDKEVRILAADLGLDEDEAFIVHPVAPSKKRKMLKKGEEETD